MEIQDSIVDILLVEDSPDDIEITKRAFKHLNLVNRLFIVRDGQEAIEFLFRQGEFSDPEKSPRPGLILLDINMPRMNGLQVLKRIKSDKDLKKIPVVMLTSSKRDEDVVKSYSYGCNSFIQKPVEFDKFVDLIKHIGLYWGLHNIPYPPDKIDLE